MEITTSPSCRVGWQGQTLRYLVRADGAAEIQVPENEGGGLRVRVTETRPTANGVEADLEVDVLNSTAY